MCVEVVISNGIKNNMKDYTKKGYSKAVLSAFGKRLVGVIWISNHALRQPYFMIHHDYKPISLKELSEPTPLTADYKKGKFVHHGRWWGKKPVLDFVGFD